MSTATIEWGLAIRHASVRAQELRIERFRLLDLLWALQREEMACARSCVQEHGLAAIETRLFGAETERLANEFADDGTDGRFRSEINEVLAAASRRARLASYPCARTDHLLVSTLELLATRHAALADLDRLRSLALDPPNCVRLVPTSRWQFLLLHWLRPSEGALQTSDRAG